MKSIKAQLSIAIVCVILGLMLAYQFQAVKNISSIASSRRIEELSTQLNLAKKQKDDLDKNVKELDKKIENYEKEAASTSGIANSLKNELDHFRMMAGSTNVSGPGISISIIPPTQNLDNKEPVPIDFLYLLVIINELNSSGAEAIMVNNQRIVSTTQIREAGNTIVINDVRYSKYDIFDVKAIGNSTTLEVAMNLNGGPKQQLSLYGINIKIQKSNNIIIFKYNKVMNFKFAKQVKEGE